MQGRSFSTRGPRRTTLIGYVLVVSAVSLVCSAAAAGAGGGNSAAEIDGQFSDSCRDFQAQSSKDISHVVLHYADGRVVKDEGTTTPDYLIDGGPGGEMDSVDVKSGRTEESFTCSASNSSPTAVLERRAGAFDPQNTAGTWTSADCGPPCFYAIPAGGNVPDESTVSFRGTASTDLDADIVSWSIDFGDGTTPASGSWTTEPPVEILHDYGFECMCTAVLTVTDSAGQSSSDPIGVTMFFVDQND